MKNISLIEMHLFFSLPAADGSGAYGAYGHGVMLSHVTGDLPRIGERIMLRTDYLDIDSVIGKYEIRVDDVCRIVGGDYPSVYRCSVGYAKWFTHETTRGGQEQLPLIEILGDWEFLENALRKRSYHWGNQRGSLIRELKFNES